MCPRAPLKALYTLKGILSPKGAWMKKLICFHSSIDEQG